MYRLSTLAIRLRPRRAALSATLTDMTDRGQDTAARSALKWATAELGVELVVAGVVRLRRSNVKTPFYEVTVRGPGGDVNVCRRFTQHADYSLALAVGRPCSIHFAQTVRTPQLTTPAESAAFRRSRDSPRGDAVAPTFMAIAGGSALTGSPTNVVRPVRRGRGSLRVVG
jgi:hypothetical protein